METEPHRLDYRLYRRWNLELATLLGSPVGAALLLRRNFRRLGNPRAGRRAVLAALLLSTAVFSVAVVVLEWGVQRSTVSILVELIFVSAVFVAFERWMKNPVEAHVGSGGPTGPWWHALAAAAVGLVIQAAIVNAFRWCCAPRSRPQNDRSIPVEPFRRSKADLRRRPSAHHRVSSGLDRTSRQDGGGRWRPSLNWDRYAGPGDATVSSPYLRSADRAQLARFVQDRAPQGREFRLQTVRGRETFSRTYLLDRQAGLNGEYIVDARVGFDTSPAEKTRPYVQVTFNRTGAELLASMTAANVKKRMAIVLDGNVDSAPLIQTAIPGGICFIHLGGLKPVNEVLQEAKDLVLTLRGGALPVPLRLVSEERIEPRGKP